MRAAPYEWHWAGHFCAGVGLVLLPPDLVATALLGFVFAKEGSAHDFIGSFRTAALIGGGAALVAALCAILLIKKSPPAA